MPVCPFQPVHGQLFHLPNLGMPLNHPMVIWPSPIKSSPETYDSLDKSGMRSQVWAPQVLCAGPNPAPVQSVHRPDAGRLWCAPIIILYRRLCRLLLGAWAKHPRLSLSLIDHDRSLRHQSFHQIIGARETQHRLYPGPGKRPSMIRLPKRPREGPVIVE